MSAIFGIYTLPVLLGAFALIAVGILVRSVFLGYPRTHAGLVELSAKEQAITAACADALFPPGGPIPVSGTEAGLVRYLDGYIRRIGPTARVLAHLLLHFVEHSPWIFGPRPVRFTRLRPEERIAALRAMSQSSMYFRRLVFLSLRVMLTMGYLAHDGVARHIGAVADVSPFEAPPESEPAAARAGNEAFA